ncbi:MAG TPA: 4Fe-4S binding protein, partial [Methanoregulaceae archaeon]|nr:4Fe-4S binding protein [Methanoregulaceae archaeon]
MSIGSVPLRYRISVDRDQCMLCERCIDSCPYGVFRKEGEQIHVNSRVCVACHRCISMCPRDAISLVERPVDYRSHPI